jgi:hypothetical protein
MTTLAEAFESFQRSAWRLEARDTYQVAEYDDQLAAFRDGQPLPPRLDGWEDVVHAATGRGAQIGRIRLVGRPITTYTRFEFVLYRENVEFGERVEVVDRSWLDTSWITAPDVWLFDDEVAFQQLYSDEGAYLGAEEVDAASVRQMRQLLSVFAVPLNKFQLDRVPAPRPETVIPVMPQTIRT